jgi:ribonuclease HI
MSAVYRVSRRAATSPGGAASLSAIVVGMPWQKMRFRGDVVHVQVDEASRLVLDTEGRAEMKYRETDSKSYRPQPSNLTPFSGAGPADEPASSRPAARGPSTRKTAAPASRPLPVPRDDAAAATPSAAPDAIFHVWTDGACSGNPGPMGIGVVVLVGDERQEIGEYLGLGTNNIAELVAIERGLEVVEGRLGTRASPGPAHARVYSDSGYAIGLLDKGWKAKANQEIVARIRQRLGAFPGRVDFVKVPGHAGVPENERCDQLGREAIVSARRRPVAVR